MPASNKMVEQLESYLVPGTHVHLVGIGGVSMRPLGIVLKDHGVAITGSDMSRSDSTDELVRHGIPVAIGHRAENVEGAACIIRTAAVHNDNPEIAAARKAGIPIFERAQAWGVIMRHYKNALCIAGTHGKTTTTSMVTQIVMEAGLDPTVMIGGSLPLLGAGHQVGSGDTIVMESCEYCNSFLNFFPTTAVILNIEEDHLDFFKDLEDIQHSFRSFAELVPETGLVLWNGDDENTRNALSGLKRQSMTFGMGSGNDITCANVSNAFRSFDILFRGSLYCHAELNVVGRHNCLDALAAAACAISLGIDGTVTAGALSRFTGADRRLQFKGTFRGADVYDDYAHHPSELRATLEAVSAMGYRRILCAFQPHTYTRTKALFEDFVRELCLPDKLILAEIYAARERNSIGISAKDIADRIDNAEFYETLPEVTDRLRTLAQPGDLILTVGAGDIYHVADALIRSES